ncbi:hypothetical protein ACKUB1_08520 [Methanospirillum stamsii]|uniref:Uncharacterized protein n=1 Tax=Methanospirillum stamsii TaxID=1277351 RepID=A0A2V2NAG4_9EURY|nr:hypothetical protein [Methanospirillum stamsii]PWR75740.1 hypothetical protein DLD82_03930 [Methanospirillum stamsii]
MMMIPAEVAEAGGSERNGSGNLPPGNKDRDDDNSSKNNNKNNFYYNERKDEDLQSTHEPVITYDSAPENFRTSASLDQNTQSDSSSVVDSTTGDDLDRGTLPLTTANTPRIPLSHIDPDDYTPMNGVWSGPCAVCGGKWAVVPVDLYSTKKLAIIYLDNVAKTMT